MRLVIEMCQRQGQCLIYQRKKNYISSSFLCGSLVQSLLEGLVYDRRTSSITTASTHSCQLLSVHAQLAFPIGLLCGVVECGVVEYGVVWCGVIWCGGVGCGGVWCGVVWCGGVWRGVVWCGVVWCGVV